MQISDKSISIVCQTLFDGEKKKMTDLFPKYWVKILYANTRKKRSTCL